MKIIEKVYEWNGKLTKRTKTNYIIIHHSAMPLSTAEEIHKSHLSKGWTGIGYHFYVRKNGTIYRGRPVNTIGAHTSNYNSESIGICFEGNFETEKMSVLQVKAGYEILSYAKGLYPGAKIVKHRDLNATACPGRNFPFDEIKKGVKEMSVNEAIEIIQAKAGLENETIEFLQCYKYGEELIKKIAEAMM